MTPLGGDLPFTPFDVSAELSRVLLFDLPATFLILFLLFRERRPSVSGFPRPRLADCAVAAVAFASLVMIALVLLLVSSLIHGSSMNPLVEAPRGLGEWSTMGLVCITTGYLEETYFRAYLFTRLEEAGLDEKWRVVVSVLLFSICHLYEGPWGVFNAAIAALILSLAYLRRKSAHGPAWAHAAYNALVYVNGT